MVQVLDQMGCSVNIPDKLENIISLVPSQTELLFDLGLQHAIKGVTRFCIHPADKVKNVTRVGGTKNFNFEKISALKPDLIIGNKEENYQEGIERLKQDYPVWMSDIENTEDALQMIEKLGELTGREEQSQLLQKSIRESFTSVNKVDNLRCAYLIWRNPYMTIGKQTFINDVLQQAGYNNVFSEFSRYPEISIQQLQQSKLDVLFLSSEPYPFKQKHIEQFSNLLPDTNVMLVDGEPFSWYGSRLLKTAAYLDQLAIQIMRNRGQ